MENKKYFCDFLHDDIFTSHISRLALMLADHYYSSLPLSEVKKEMARSIL